VTRLTISNDGGAILIRQGTTVIVLAPDQSQSVAATIVLEFEKLKARSVSCRVCFDYQQFCELHNLWQDDPRHEYKYPDCERHLVNLQCPECRKTMEYGERRAVREFDAAVRGFYAAGGSRHSSRTIEADGNDETETMSDGRQRLREACLDGTDSTGG
jgi:hypothetical protein